MTDLPVKFECHSSNPDKSIKPKPTIGAIGSVPINTQSVAVFYDFDIYRAWDGTKS